MFTVMVVLEKDGISASAGGMRGSIMANTIDVLVDAYNFVYAWRSRPSHLLRRRRMAWPMRR